MKHQFYTFFPITLEYEKVKNHVSSPEVDVSYPSVQWKELCFPESIPGKNEIEKH